MDASAVVGRFVAAVDAERLGAYGVHVLVGDDEAGHRWRSDDRENLYSDASTYVAMRLLGAVVGDVRDWLMPRLFDPLGIHNSQWHRCPGGWIVGGSGLELRTEELARIGRLLRDRGALGGRVSCG